MKATLRATGAAGFRPQRSCTSEPRSYWFFNASGLGGYDYAPRASRPAAHLGLILLVLFVAASQIIRADLPSEGPVLPAANAAASPAEQALADASPVGLLGDWWGGRTAADKLGIRWALSYTGELLGNATGGFDQGVIAEGLLKAVVDVDFDKLAGWPGSQFHVSGLYPHGDSLSERCLGDLYILSSIDAPDSPRLFELWLQQDLWDHTVSLRAGQLAADEEFAGTEYGCLFINGTCGWPAFVALNVPSPAYPVAAPGARLAINLGKSWSWQTAVYDGSPDPLDASGRSTNPNGTRFRLNGAALVMAELSHRWNQAPESGLPGFVKLGSWWHSDHFDDLHWDTTGLSLADPASSQVAASHSGNWGVYAAGQQQLWREHRVADANEQGLGVFGRTGWTPSDRNLLQFYWESGLNYRGLIPGRNQDQCGVAVVYGAISDALRELRRENNSANQTAKSLPDYEMVLEAAYRVTLRPGWSLQPSIEYLMHPGGSAARGNALVLGLRTYLDL
jgi:porin